MAIEKLNMNWKNKGETGAIPINATNLNKMSNKTDELVTGINGLQNDSGLKTIGSPIISEYRKIGNVCMFRTSYYSSLTIAAYSDTTIGTLSKEYRPAMDFRVGVAAKDASNTPIEGMLLVFDSDGTIRLQNWTGKSITSAALQVEATYLTN